MTFLREQAETGSSSQTHPHHRLNLTFVTHRRRLFEYSPRGPALPRTVTHLQVSWSIYGDDSGAEQSLLSHACFSALVTPSIPRIPGTEGLLLLLAGLLFLTVTPARMLECRSSGMFPSHTGSLMDTLNSGEDPSQMGQ
ncbi:unnamed protein product [Pleuronectes platessa]|uniref:Uncharacterized protein n=1 Tax=Pleuronectes platessa TaxID=8262 RepID=A0A9N7TR56_PLEPL|nr:unnamed protein product [Pleuronectes platessa]